jgi:multicomponent Na+:H+ antiporter subunit G
MLVGLWVHIDEQQTGMKIVLAMFFQMVTIPIASHLIGLLAFQADIPRWRGTPSPKDESSDSKSPKNRG